MLRTLLAVLILCVLAVLAIAWFRPGWIYVSSMLTERSLAGLATKRVVVDGLEWSYLEGGDGEPLVLVHGFSADKDNWTRMARHLTDDFHIIAPDLVGFGTSDRSRDLSYSIAAQTTRLIAFLDALGVERFHLGGSSMGGYMAGELVARQPGRVRSLILLAPGGLEQSPPSAMFDMIAERDRNPLIPQTVEDFDYTLDFVFEEPPFLPSPVRRYLAERQVERRDLLQQIFEDLRYHSQPLEPDLDGWNGPTLVIWGVEDRVLHPDGAEVLRHLLPQARIEVLPDTGHLPMLERPEETARLILDFAESTRTAGGS